MSATTKLDTTPRNRPLAGAQVGISPRRMDFEFDPASVSRYYYDNNPFHSTFMTALSALFPEGESFFVESVRAYRDQITDPVLKAQVSGFIGQEAMHSKEHKAFNDAATAQGYPVQKMDAELGKVLALGQKVLPKPVQLAITVALEHYTAIIAEMLLRDEDVQRRFSPEMFKLWAWHALEENEHKVVAYDVYEKPWDLMPYVWAPWFQSLPFSLLWYLPTMRVYCAMTASSLTSVKIWRQSNTYGMAAKVFSHVCCHST